MKKSSKKLIVALLCAAAAVLVGLVAYDGIKQSREFSSSSAMMNTAVSADIEGKDAKKVGEAIFDCISAAELFVTVCTPATNFSSNVTIS